MFYTCVVDLSTKALLKVSSFLSLEKEKGVGGGVCRGGGGGGTT